MTGEELEGCLKDPQNRRWGVYYCKADPRVIVPKQHKWMGWTINFARPSAIPIVLLALAIVVLPAQVARSWNGGIGATLTGVAISIVVLCLLCGYLSSTKRRGD